MKPMTTLIIENGLHKDDAYTIRETVRAIIMNPKKEVLMCYSKMFDDYTFPGGGIDLDESKEDALIRELKEELGARQVIIIKKCGYIEELKYGTLDQNHVFLQRSTYFACHVENFGKQQLMSYEKVHGLEPRWVKIDEAIQKNNHVIKDKNHQKIGLKTTLIRENKVLKFLKENSNLCENSKL